SCDDLRVRMRTRLAQQLQPGLRELPQTSRARAHIAEARARVIQLVRLGQVVQLAGSQLTADGSGQFRPQRELFVVAMEGQPRTLELRAGAGQKERHPLIGGRLNRLESVGFGRLSETI